MGNDVANLQWIRPREYRHEWHICNCDYRAKSPYFEIDSAKPSLLDRAGVYQEEPEAEL